MCFPTATTPPRTPTRSLADWAIPSPRSNAGPCWPETRTPQFVTFFVPAPRNPPPRDPTKTTRSHMLAADLEGIRLPPSDTPEYVVQVQDSHLGFPADRLQVYEFKVDWNSPASSTLIPTQSLVPEPFNSNACHDEFFCIKQPARFSANRFAFLWLHDAAFDLPQFRPSPNVAVQSHRGGRRRSFTGSRRHTLVRACA